MLLACGVLGLRHQAEVVHVLDQRTGHDVHSIGQTCDDSLTQAHVHAPPTSDHVPESCSLSAATQQMAVPVITPHLLALAATFVPVASPTAGQPRVRSLLHAAPKTSPPAA